MTCLFVSGRGSLGSLRIPGRWIIHNPNPSTSWPRLCFSCWESNGCLWVTQLGGHEQHFTLTGGVLWNCTHSPLLHYHPPTQHSSHHHITSHPLALLWNYLLEGHLHTADSLQFVLIPSCFKVYCDHEHGFLHEVHVFSRYRKKKKNFYSGAVHQVN